MATQDRVDEKQFIQLKRIKSLTDDSTAAEYTLDKILLYGEPLYVEDMGVIVVGDGVYNEITNEVTGSTVEELLDNHKFFSNVEAPMFFKKGFNYPSIYDTPIYKLGSDSKSIVNQKYVNDALASLTYNSGTNLSAGKSITKITQSDGKINITAADSKVMWSNVTGDKPLHGNHTPLVDGAQGHSEGHPGVNTYYYSKDDHIHPTDKSRAAVADRVASIDEKTYYTLENFPTATAVINYTNNKFIERAGTNPPAMDGTASAGTSLNFSREDHVHPSDTSRESIDNKVTNIRASIMADDEKYPTEKATAIYAENKANAAINYIATVYAKMESPTFKGTPKAPTAVLGTNDTQIATTAFVQTALDNKSIVETKTSKPDGIIHVTGINIAESRPQQLYYCDNGTLTSGNGVRINCSTGVIMGAAWNDFAEYRKCNCNVPGSVVCEVGDGTLEISKNSLQPGAYVISDTYGLTIGDDSEGMVPVAVAGRVLVKYSGTIKKYTPGAAVCAGRDGKVEVMSRRAIKKYPDRILGYVSEIPSYKIWNNVEVKDRIWIKVV